MKNNIIHKLKLILKKFIYPVPKNIKLLRKISKIKKKIGGIEIILNSQGEVFHKNSIGADFFIDISNHFHHHIAGEQIEFRTVMKFIKENLSNSATILDIGANIGLYSISIAKELSDCTVYAFEPVNSTYNILLKNISRNKFQERIIPNKNAVGENESRIIITNTYDTGNYIQSLEKGTSIKSELVDMITIDNYCLSRNIKNIDFIKCDVEGYEKNVLMGGLGIINKCKPIILLELSEEMSNRYKYLPVEIIELLKYNYNVFSINNYDGKINEYNDESSKFEDIIKISNNYLFVEKGKDSKIL
jgi:FkbM family methyltransferase